MRISFLIPAFSVSKEDESSN